MPILRFSELLERYPLRELQCAFGRRRNGNPVTTQPFTAPSQHGRYYLCIDEPPPWQFGVPGSDFSHYIGVVDVQ